MTRAIQQSVVLKATPEKLFETFLDSKKHTAATGMPAKTSSKVGGKFAAFGGQIYGRNLVLVPGKMIVQSWRSKQWKSEDQRFHISLAL